MEGISALDKNFQGMVVRDCRDSSGFKKRTKEKNR